MTRQTENEYTYTTTSDLTKTLLHTFQRAVSDFLALFIRVSKLGRPVKSTKVAY